MSVMARATAAELPAKLRRPTTRKAEPGASFQYGGHISGVTARLYERHPRGMPSAGTIVLPSSVSEREAATDTG